jgi:hypothetical protein
MVINNKFNLGDKVFLETDEAQSERIVTNLIILPNLITYGVSCGTVESCHYDFELNAEKDVLKTFTD